jgi:hypothetical protein
MTTPWTERVPADRKRRAILSAAGTIDKLPDGALHVTLNYQSIWNHWHGIHDSLAVVLKGCYDALIVDSNKSLGREVLIKVPASRAAVFQQDLGEIQKQHRAEDTLTR